MTETTLHIAATMAFLGISLLSFKYSYLPRGDGGYIKRRVTLFYIGFLMFYLGLTRALGVLGYITIEQQRLSNTFAVVPTFLLILFETTFKVKNSNKPKNGLE